MATKTYKYRAYMNQKVSFGNDSGAPEMVADPDQVEWIIKHQHEYAAAITRLFQAKKEKSVSGEQFATFRKKIYGDSPLHWSTKNTVLDFREQAAKTTKAWYAELKHEDGVCACGTKLRAGDKVWMTNKPKFKILGCHVCRRGLRQPDRDTVAIGGQLVANTSQYAKMSVQNILAGKCSRMRIEGEGKHRVMRIALEEGKWMSMAIVYHRDLPNDGRVLEAKFSRQRVGSKHEWHALLVVTTPEVEAVPPSAKGAVGFDIGWRHFRDGTRVMTWVDSDNNSGTVMLPQRLLDRCDKLSHLQKIIDTEKNELQAYLSGARKKKYWPEWLLDATSTMHLWRSPERFAHLYTQWRESVSDLDRVDFQVLQRWYRSMDANGRVHGYAHLRSWIENQRKRLNRQKREFYRQAARGQHGGVDVRKYAKVAFEDLDGTQMAQLASGDARQLAAPFMFKTEIAQYAGPRVVDVPAPYTSQTCPFCGTVEKCEDVRTLTAILHTCSACGQTIDRDIKGATNVCRLAITGASLGPKLKRERRGDASARTPARSA